MKAHSIIRYQKHTNCSLIFSLQILLILMAIFPPSCFVFNKLNTKECVFVEVLQCFCYMQWVVWTSRINSIQSHLFRKFSKHLGIEGYKIPCSWTVYRVQIFTILSRLVVHHLHPSKTVKCEVLNVTGNLVYTYLKYQRVSF